MYKYVLVIALLLATTVVFGQKLQSVIQINWYGPSMEAQANMLQCSGCQQDSPDSKLLFNKVEKGIRRQVVSSITFQTLVTEDLSELEKSIVGHLINELPATPEILFKNVSQRKEPYLVYSFIPLVNQRGQLKKVVSFTVNKIYTPQLTERKRNKSFISNSALSSGTWYKVGVLSDGVYKLDYNFLANIGIDVGSVNPTSINVYGNGAGLLPESNASFRYDDLSKNAVAFIGNEADGSFDPSDYILFYANGPHRIRQSGNEFTHDFNHYCDTSYYFIRVDGSVPAKRILNQNQSSSTPTHTVNTFNHYQFMEKELFNFWESGREWYGDTYNSVTSAYTYSFSVPNVTTDSVKLLTKLASRSVISNNFTISVMPGVSGTVTCGSIAGQQYTYAKLGSSTLYFENAPSTISVSVSYDLAGSMTAEGYMDEIQLNTRRGLTMTSVGSSLVFQDLKSVGTGNVADFQLSGANNVTAIWEVTEHHDITSIGYTDLGSMKTFAMNTDSLRKFVAITSGAGSQPFS
ncbi:MAG: hypothetical protein JKY54_13940, partial [Flavobacteriales bacterium]|nr:hypothetical protein [Flavobacteriales bacterium]